MTDQPADRDSGKLRQQAPWWALPLAAGFFGAFAAGCFGIFTTLMFGSSLLLLGLLMLCGTVYWCVSTLRFVRVAISADGVVIGLEERLETDPDGPDVPHFYPRVEFETADHGKQVFTSDDGSRQATCRVGDPVRVLYDPARPQVARIDKDLWAPLVVGGVLGACFLVSGLYLFLIGIHVLPGEIHWE